MAGFFFPGDARTIMEISLCLPFPIVMFFATSQSASEPLPVHWVTQPTGRLLLEELLTTDEEALLEFETEGLAVFPSC